MIFRLFSRVIVPLLSILAFAGAAQAPSGTFVSSLAASPVSTASTSQNVSSPGTWAYDLVASDGGVFTFGDSGFYGSAGAITLNKPVVGMAATPDGKGYWLVASDGGIFSFGDAAFYGSTGNLTLNKPVVGMAATPDGKGYWLVASDGGIFSFGDAAFYGSTGNLTLNKPVVGMAVDPATGGYWLVAADGGIFSFNAPFMGSMGGTQLNEPVVAVADVTAVDPYGPGQYGSDISWPQCTPMFTGTSSSLLSFPANNGVAVVGTTFETSMNGYLGGTFADTFGTNSCLKMQFAQAVFSGAHPSLYAVFWSAPAASTNDPMLFNGPQASCASSTSTDAVNCQAYDWGYNLAAQAVDYATSQGASSQLWWLDLEVGSPSNGDALWSQDLVANSNVVLGALDEFHLLGDQPGIYSTSLQFGMIVGPSFSPRLPIWIAGATSATQAAAWCADPTTWFGGGVPWLIQGPYLTVATTGGTTKVDSDFAC